MSAFNHIPNRAAASSTQPSEFLVGPKGTLRPCLEDLYYPNLSVVSTVKINYQEGDGSTKQVTRYFHDIARRTLFLAWASLDPQTNGPRGRNPLFDQLCGVTPLSTPCAVPRSLHRSGTAILSTHPLSLRFHVSGLPARRDHHLAEAGKSSARCRVRLLTRRARNAIHASHGGYFA